MDILRSIVGNNVLELFTDNVAFNMAELLEESKAEKEATTNARCFMKC